MLRLKTFQKTVFFGLLHTTCMFSCYYVFSISTSFRVPAALESWSKYTTAMHLCITTIHFLFSKILNWLSYWCCFLMWSTLMRTLLLNYLLWCVFQLSKWAFCAQWIENKIDEQKYLNSNKELI